MKVYKEEQLKLNDSVVTIGAFDGLHRGHQALIERTVKSARALGVPSVVYTFDPPPRVLFQGKMNLMSVEEKLEILRNFDVDYVIVADFNKAYASKLPSEFINELSMLGPKEIVIGSDFTFGKNKAGDVNLLIDYYDVMIHPDVCCEEGKVISSTRIRDHFKNNEMRTVTRLLNHRQLEKI